MDHGGNQNNGTRNMKNVKDVQKIISANKISKRYNEQCGVLQKKLILDFFKKTLELESAF